MYPCAWMEDVYHLFAQVLPEIHAFRHSSHRNRQHQIVGKLRAKKNMHVSLKKTKDERLTKEDLGGLTSACVTAVYNILAHKLEQGKSAFEGLLAAADHEGERALLGTADTA